jgi:hypothetical protein
MFSRRTRTIGAAGVVALALGLVQVALAEVPVVKFNAADQAAAKAALLTLADFRAGSGWKGGPQKQTKAFTADVCPGLWDPKQADLVITGVAASEFTGPGMHASSGVQVYRTIQMARLDWKRSVVDPAFVRCLKRQAAANPTPNVRFVSVNSTPFPRIGQQAAARIRVIADAMPAGGGAPVRIVVDEVAFGRGRVGISLSLSGPYAGRAALDAAEVRMAQTIVHRIRPS